MSKQDEEFLRKTLVGVVDEKEREIVIQHAKNVAKSYNISLSELINYLFSKFSEITGIEKANLLIKLIGLEN